MKIIEPTTAKQLQQYYELRWKVLCAPWNQPRNISRDSSDETSTHMMAINTRQQPLGVGRLHFNAPGDAQIRFMAIDTNNQNKGIGAALLAALEKKAGTLGARQIKLNSRETALGFYIKNGYVAEGPGHVLFDCIPHVKMRKIL